MLLSAQLLRTLKLTRNVQPSRGNASGLPEFHGKERFPRACPGAWEARGAWNRVPRLLGGQSRGAEGVDSLFPPGVVFLLQVAPRASAARADAFRGLRWADVDRRRNYR